jgi:prevent-host-death family protein
MARSFPLSEAKARLSEVVRLVRTSGTEALITVDGRAAVRIVPVIEAPVVLSDAEIATTRALLNSLRRLRRRKGTFDAVESIREGRR